MAVAAAPIIFAGSELFIGIKVLKQGVKNVDAYFNRLDEIMKQIDADERGIPKKEVPLPMYPGDFKTEEEEAEKLSHAEGRQKWPSGTTGNERPRMRPTDITKRRSPRSIN